MRPVYWILLVLGLVLILALQFPYAVKSSDDKFHLFYMTLLLLFVGGSAAASRRLPMSQALRYALIWLGLILVLVFGYTQRHILMDNTLFAELMPHRARIAADGTMSIRAGEDGHFHVEAEVNGAPVKFMIDTGATDIVLSARDATRAGFDPATLNYTRAYQTANGYSTGAPVKIGRLVVGSMVLTDVSAAVSGGDLDQSLLGLEFLGRLKSYGVEGDTLVLTP